MTIQNNRTLIKTKEPTHTGESQLISRIEIDFSFICRMMFVCKQEMKRVNEIFGGQERQTMLANCMDRYQMWRTWKLSSNEQKEKYAKVSWEGVSKRKQMLILQEIQIQILTKDPQGELCPEEEYWFWTIDDIAM